jgi:hypothetical protein
MTPIVFNLTGKLFKMELYITAILLILSIIFLFGIARPWKAMFFFFILCMINMCGIYTRTWLLAPLILPGIFALVGLYASAINLKDDEDDFEYSEEDTEPVEPYYEEQKAKAEAPKKAPARKPAKKKTARKKKK